jgi:glyoxylase-like metal-dependent hydrolase (beta-lactamase superfamily II)
MLQRNKGENPLLSDTARDASTLTVSAAPPAIAYDAVELRPGDEPRAVVTGLLGVRFELPFALDHVNVWLLEDVPGWTVIDAGLADERSRERWQGLRAGALAGVRLARLIATHFHPDHMGLAGWLCALTGAGLWASRTEWLMGRLLAQDTSEGFVAAGQAFDRRAGLDEELVATRAARGNLYRRRAVVPPASFRRLRDGDEVPIGGRAWRVIVGRGHAPEMLCLYDARSNVLIAADQILPRISPNVGVWPAEPEANPLGDFLGSLERFRALPDDCLVLPSHGRPFRGLHARIEQLAAHHEERLEATLAACTRPATAVEIMPRLFDRELDIHQLAFALGETIAHLNHLLADGRLARREGDDGRLRYEVR